MSVWGFARRTLSENCAQNSTSLTRSNFFVFNYSAGKTGADSKKKGTKASASATAKGSTTFKEDEGEVDAMEEEMGAAAAADADQERVSFACFGGWC